MNRILALFATIAFTLGAFTIPAHADNGDPQPELPPVDYCQINNGCLLPAPEEPDCTNGTWCPTAVPVAVFDQTVKQWRTAYADEHAKVVALTAERDRLASTIARQARKIDRQAATIKRLRAKIRSLH